MADPSISAQVLDMMKPHIGSVWQKSESTRFLKKAANILQIEPDYRRLKMKTEECARQVIWELVKPRVDNAARELVRERFIRAVMVTCAQKVKDSETTFSLRELRQFFRQYGTIDVAREEWPIFGISPLGYTLAQTFLRLSREIEQPENEGLRPVIVLISDGMSTDSEETKPAIVAERIKQAGIPIICGFIMDEDIGNPRILRGLAGWRWSKATYVLRVLAIALCEMLGEKLSMDNRVDVKERRQTIPWWFALSLFISRCMSVGRHIVALCYATTWIAMWHAIRKRLQVVDTLFAALLVKSQRTVLKKYLDSMHWPKPLVVLIDGASDMRMRLVAGDLMYSLASSVEEWPEIGEQFRGGFRLEKHARFFVQVNHTRNLRELIEGMLKPVAEEHQEK